MTYRLEPVGITTDSRGGITNTTN
ncbi:hypothetical protein CCACVL1_05074 [Corchorus capsularis]|uniref:Uncharacterized protein n=1 Tax=Corchorus capsularis TaxID=210143 RepID=A0A1R3JMN7_COCAP|nr:hypothetical protein CCACVL1_05074 [Corchorus capsularis]